MSFHHEDRPLADLVNISGNLDTDFIPPSIIIDVYESLDCFPNLVRHMSFVGYTGGSLPKDIEDTISSKTKLMKLIGVMCNVKNQGNFRVDFYCC